MKKKLLFFASFIFIFSIFLSNPEKVRAVCDIKTGFSVACSNPQEPLQCVVGGDFYCCDNSDSCTAQLNQGNGATCQSGQGDEGESCCGGQGGSCNTGFVCSYAQAPSGSLGYYCLTQDQITTSGVMGRDPTCMSGTGIYTAIGCVPFQNTNDFTGTIFKWALGIGGGISFLLIVYGGFVIMASSGNPDNLKDGQGIMIAAISGVVLLIFSVFILQFIGVNILGLPGF